MYIYEHMKIMEHIHGGHTIKIRILTYEVYYNVFSQNDDLGAFKGKLVIFIAISG